MDNATALAHEIGVRVKHARQARRWTLDRLAEEADVSRRQLVNLEQGTTNASIGILLKISDALGIGLPALVAPSRTAPVTVTRSGDGPVLWNGTSGGRGVLVAGTQPPDVVELWDWTLGVGDRYQSTAHASGTKELLHVLHGTVLVDVADRSVNLDPGDAVTFAGDVPHVYANSGQEPARFSLAVFEPRVGAGSQGGGGRA